MFTRQYNFFLIFVIHKYIFCDFHDFCEVLLVQYDNFTPPRIKYDSATPNIARDS